MRAILVGASLFLSAFARAEDAGNFEQKLADFAQNGQWHAAVALYKDREAGMQGLSPEALYALGASHMRLNRPRLAEPLLQESRKSGFKGFKDWPSVEELLERALEVRRLSPPERKDPWDSSELPRMRIHSHEKLTGLPRVSILKDIGRMMYLVDLPVIDLYLAPDLEKCSRLKAALFGDEMARPDFHGGVNAVVVCRGLDQQFLPEALHPIGHAWVLSYLGSRHRREPATLGGLWWVEEGLADLAAYIVDPEFGARQSQRVLQKIGSGASPPSLGELGQGGPDAELHELMASLLTAHLIDPRHPARVRLVLDKLAETHDAESAFDLVVKKSPSQEYQRIVASFWIDKKPLIPEPFARR